MPEFIRLIDAISSIMNASPQGGAVVDAISGFKARVSALEEDHTLQIAALQRMSQEELQAERIKMKEKLEAAFGELKDINAPIDRTDANPKGLSKDIDYLEKIALLSQRLFHLNRLYSEILKMLDKN